MPPRTDTRTRILIAARAEFAARGFAGARVDAIATRAKANKGMLYYYFRSKRRLFNAVLEDAFRMRTAGLALTTDPVSGLIEWYGRVSQAQELCRLMQWEALEHGRAGALPAEAQSMADHLKTTIRRVRRTSACKDFDPQSALLALVAVTVFPVIFPRFAELLTGAAVDTSLFRQKQARLLRILLNSE